MSSGHGEKLSRKQEIAVAALLSCPTVAEAAGSVGIGSTTLRRWMRQDEFRRAADRARRDVLGEVSRRLVAAAGDALSCLLDIMNDGEASAASRVSAAGKIFDLIGAELGVQEPPQLPLIERLEAQERELFGSGSAMEDGPF